MKKTFCDCCCKEVEEPHTIEVYYHKWGGGERLQSYELCNACYKAMQREIPKLLNWRNRLR